MKLQKIPYKKNYKRLNGFGECVCVWLLNGLGECVCVREGEVYWKVAVNDMTKKESFVFYYACFLSFLLLSSFFLFLFFCTCGMPVCRSRLRHSTFFFFLSFFLFLSVFCVCYPSGLYEVSKFLFMVRKNVRKGTFLIRFAFFARLCAQKK